MAIQARLKLITVTTAGTPVPILGTSDIKENCIGCRIQAQGSSTVFVGDSTVNHSTKGIKVTGDETVALSEGDSNVIDLGSVYIDASANGGAASVLYFVRV